MSSRNSLFDPSYLFPTKYFSQTISRSYDFMGNQGGDVLWSRLIGILTHNGTILATKS